MPSRRLNLWLLVGVCLLLSGCDPADPFGQPRADQEPVILAPWGSISVYQLAGRLNMTVDRADENEASLRGNGINHVMLYAWPSSRVYVNGTRVDFLEFVTPAEGVLFVPESIVGSIRKMMRQPSGQTAVGPTPHPKPKPKPKPTARPVVIDAGHGGHDPGAPGVIGIPEKDINLPVALKVAQKLKARGIPVILTRSTDVFVELNERADIANRAGAALFVSIHSDASEANPDARGYTVFTARSPDGQSVALADGLSRRMTAAGVTSRGVQQSNLRVLVRTICPAALVELGFLTNSYEAQALAMPGYQDRLAQAVADGIVGYLQSGAALGASRKPLDLAPVGQ